MGNEHLVKDQRRQNIPEKGSEGDSHIGVPAPRGLFHWGARYTSHLIDASEQLDVRGGDSTNGSVREGTVRQGQAKAG